MVMQRNGVGCDSRAVAVIVGKEERKDSASHKALRSISSRYMHTFSPFTRAQLETAGILPDTEEAGRQHCLLQIRLIMYSFMGNGA